MKYKTRRPLGLLVTQRTTHVVRARFHFPMFLCQTVFVLRRGPRLFGLNRQMTN